MNNKTIQNIILSQNQKLLSCSVLQKIHSLGQPWNFLETPLFHAGDNANFITKTTLRCLVSKTTCAQSVWATHLRVPVPAPALGRQSSRAGPSCKIFPGSTAGGFGLRRL